MPLSEAQQEILSHMCGLTVEFVRQLWKEHEDTAIRPGKLDLLFRISHLLNLHVGGRSLFINSTSKCYLHSVNLHVLRYGHKSGHVTAWKAIMTDDTAGLRGSGR